jgi:hypothetical protein
MLIGLSSQAPLQDLGFGSDGSMDLVAITSSYVGEALQHNSPHNPFCRVDVMLLDDYLDPSCSPCLDPPSSSCFPNDLRRKPLKINNAARPIATKVFPKGTWRNIAVRNEIPAPAKLNSSHFLIATDDLSKLGTSNMIIVLLYLCCVFH